MLHDGPHSSHSQTGNCTHCHYVADWSCEDLFHEVVIQILSGAETERRFSNKMGR